MTNKTLNKIIISATTAMLLTACGGSSSGGETPKKDTTKPVITLNSGNISLTVGDTYKDAGAKATDDVDGDITKNIKTTGSVDTTKVGTYTITYTVSDAAGNKATAKRTVKVNPVPLAVVNLADAVAQTYTKDSAIATLTFVNSGGAVASCSVAPALPTGLSVGVNNNSCEITGTPTAVKAKATYKVTGTNASGSDTASVDITVNDIPNKAPTANAGADVSVVVNTAITLTGSGTDTDGTIASYSWSDASGTELATTASFEYTPTAVGTDRLTLTVTDDDGATAEDTVDVTVNPRLTVGATSITDTLTGLVWDKNASDVGTCASPKSEPTIEQFQTILAYNQSSPALPTGFNIAVNNDLYKTSDGWKIYLKYGTLDNDTTGATKTICVDATNEISKTLKPLTKDTDTGEVTDPNTGLIWSDTLELKEYADAEAYCIAKGGMRLPTITELDALYDRENNKTVAPFEDLHNGYYWSSTEGVDSEYNFIMGFDDGNSSDVIRRGQISGAKRENPDTQWVRCVKDAN